MVPVHAKLGICYYQPILSIFNLFMLKNEGNDMHQSAIQANKRCISQYKENDKIQTETDKST